MVLSVMDTIKDQLAGVIAIEAVEDCVAVTAGLHKPRQPEFRKVLRNRRRWLSDRVGELPNGKLLIEKTPQQGEPRAVGQHPENLDSEVDLIGRRQTYVSIYVHT